MIAGQITQKIGEAMKAHDEVRLSTLRMLSSALNYELIAKQHKLSVEEEIVVVRREAKKRKDAIEVFSKPGTSTSTKEEVEKKIEKEKAELAILQEYLPKEMSEEELKNLVDEVVKETQASTIKDMGKVIGLVMTKAKGQAEGSKVSELVKLKLT